MADEGFAAERAIHPDTEEIMVICKNPLCMRFFVVASQSNLEGLAKVKLTCPECKHEHEYQRKDLHLAAGPEGTAVIPFRSPTELLP